MKINILGTKYRIVVATEDEDPKFKECDGYMDPTVKEIVVGKFEPDSDPMGVKDLESYTKQVMRHEIIHAFLYESGLWDNSGDVKTWAKSEEITDWIAIQAPKLFKAFKEAGAI